MSLCVIDLVLHEFVFFIRILKEFQQLFIERYHALIICSHICI